MERDGSEDASEDARGRPDGSLEGETPEGPRKISIKLIPPKPKPAASEDRDQEDDVPARASLPFLLVNAFEKN